MCDFETIILLTFRVAPKNRTIYWLNSWLNYSCFIIITTADKISFKVTIAAIEGKTTKLNIINI